MFFTSSFEFISFLSTPFIKNLLYTFINSINNLASFLFVDDELITLIKDSVYNETTSFLNILKSNNIDALGFKKIIYNKTKNKLDSIKELDYNLDIKVILDREETIFENIGAKKNEI